MLPNNDKHSEEHPIIPVSDELYHEVVNVLDELGLDLQTAINIYLKKIAATRSIPFQVGSNPVPHTVPNPTNTSSNVHTKRYGINPDA